MDAIKLKRKTDAVLGQMIMITGKTNDPSVVEKLKTMLKEANIEDVLLQTCPNFDEWMKTLPDEPIPGLVNECWSWIRHWGNGGGDYSTETQIQEAITELGSDVPKELADAMYCSVAEYSKSPFEASALVMDILTECLADCQVKIEEDAG